MKGILICMSVVLSASLCLAQEEDPQKEAEKEAAARDRQQHLQLMTDRLVHKLPQFALMGTLKRLGGDQYSINGEPFSINKDTRIQGQMKSGVDAEARGFIEPGKPKIATQVVVLEQSANQSSNETPPDLGHTNLKNTR